MLYAKIFYNKHKWWNTAPFWELGTQPINIYGKGYDARTSLPHAT